MAKFNLSKRMVWHKHDDVNHPPVTLEAGDHDTDDLPPWLAKRMEEKGFIQKMEAKAVALEQYDADTSGEDKKGAVVARRGPGRPPKDAPSGSEGV